MGDNNAKNPTQGQEQSADDFAQILTEKQNGIVAILAGLTNQDAKYVLININTRLDSISLVTVPQK